MLSEDQQDQLLLSLFATAEVMPGTSHMHSERSSMGIFHYLLEKLDWAIAGLLGALVATRWHKDDLLDRKAWILFLLTGMACAHYLTGMVSTYFGIVEPRSVAGVGFLLGTFGGSLIAAVTRAIKAADLWSVIRSKFGGPNG